MSKERRDATGPSLPGPSTARTPEHESALPRYRSPTALGFSVVAEIGVDHGTSASTMEGRLTIGTEPNNGLVLREPTVSRYHVELEMTPSGVAIRDLGSTNGTWLEGVRIREAVAARGVKLGLGNAKVSIFIGDHAPPARLPAPAFGRLVGSSAVMQEAYLLLQRAAPTGAPVLIMGESGTGKELAARALHGASPRREQPFEIVDCGGLPPALMENELFGHERGAFTHAFAQEEGAFQRAEGGTLFLDEIGELPLEVQPKLLRALGERTVRRIGGKAVIPVDVRVVAATNRDLRREVNAGRFRADLFYRLAVIEVRMPALRDRLEDLREIVPILLDTIVRERSLARRLAPDEALYATLAGHSWPGNVRELRNYLEQLLILDRPEARPAGAGAEARPEADPALGEAFGLPLRLAKDHFERAYVARLLAATAGNVAEAARRAGVDRRTLFRTLRRFGMKARDDEGD